jgi:hypothetical protein
MSQLGQLVASHVAEVEDIEEKQHRAPGGEIAEADRLFEASPETELGGDISYAGPNVIWLALEGSLRREVHDLPNLPPPGGAPSPPVSLGEGHFYPRHAEPVELEGSPVG